MTLFVEIGLSWSSTGYRGVLEGICRGLGVLVQGDVLRCCWVDRSWTVQLRPPQGCERASEIGKVREVAPTFLVWMVILDERHSCAALRNCLAAMLAKLLL